jgi:3-deoxy-D-manno-octulosonic acid (KDO) 8-phosphate synthase
LESASEPFFAIDTLCGSVYRAAIAVGVSGLFMETHPNPAKALSDGPNSMPIDKMGELLKTLQGLDDWVKNGGFRDLCINRDD